MITGNIEERVYPRIFITALTPVGDIVKKVLVDTGFDGEVAMHYDEADRYKLNLEDSVEIEYASGEVIEELYCKGEVLWFGEARKVQIILSHDEEPAIGTRLLNGCIMNMNFINDFVTIDKP